MAAQDMRDEFLRPMREHQHLYATINRLLENPETAKDGTILWLTHQLEQALTKLQRIRAAAR